MYCCGSCTVAAWRNILAGGLYDGEKFLAAGMKALKARRDGKGRWRAFPYWYTLSALLEVEGRAAREEKRYAAGGCERLVKGRRKGERYERRRREVAERILAQA